MPDPVSALGICYLAGYAALTGYARGGSAISSEARAARNAAIAVVESVERSHVLFGEKAAVISQLMALADDCSEPGWDGAEASPINPLAVFVAESFLRALPEGFPIPELAPEPDGGISLDWIQSRSRLVSVSVGTTHRLAYAWLDGADRGHAVARFDGENVPPRVLEAVRGIISHGNSSLRAA